MLDRLVSARRSVVLLNNAMTLHEQDLNRFRNKFSNESSDCFPRTALQGCKVL